MQVIIASLPFAAQMRQSVLFFAAKRLRSPFFYTLCISTAYPKAVENPVENVENPCFLTLFSRILLKTRSFSPLFRFTLRFISFTISPSNTPPDYA